MLILSPFQKPDSLVLGVQKPGVGGSNGGCTRVKKVTSGNAVGTSREVQTEGKADTWMKEVESSSTPGKDVDPSPTRTNIPTSEVQCSSKGGCTSSQRSNMKPGAGCKVPASECEAPGTRASVGKATNGVRSKSEGGTPGRGGKAGHQRRLVINLDDKNKFTEEVTV